MLRLPEVTLVLIETRQNTLGAMAVEECLNKASFGEVLIFTNSVESYGHLFDKMRIVEVEDWPDKVGWSRFNWAGVAPYLRTPFSLLIQWDSWIVNPVCWRPEFLNYDYIGAPWWYSDGRNVGNGGFAIRSTRLLKFLANNLADFPCVDALDDDLLCRRYRFALEKKGFTWAPEKLAWHFAFEHKKPDHLSFGFHAMHNWGYVLTPEDLLKRAKICKDIPYMTKNSWMWDRLLERNPNLKNALEFDEPKQIDPGLGDTRCNIPLATPVLDLSDVSIGPSFEFGVVEPELYSEQYKKAE